ncbi:MAG: uroporphyrinogen-III C-methyltransferase, partial [Gammaproteobacteria bacterium]|nr:uroporphyrinogen-III C-methyltransferase [Gammaproteobacteria bacterium]
MNYLPIYLDLRDARVCLVGAGVPLHAKLHHLLKTPAQLVVYTAQADRELVALACDGRIALHAGLPDDDALQRSRLVYLAGAALPAQRGLRARCTRLGVLCNTVDDAAASDFVSPAIVDRAPVVVAIGSEGAAPTLVRHLKSRIEKLLGPETAALARLAGALRPVVRSTLAPAARRRFWARLFAHDGARLLRDQGAEQARRLLHDALRRDGAAVMFAARGRVSLVGAGPGDPELLTERARARLEQANVVLIDGLVDRRILDLARRDARIVDVGKRAGLPSPAQRSINERLIREARAGLQVVRLKSGDPMVFGRADEELDALVAAGVDYEVVPGITAAAAAAARIGASLTRRGRNSALAIVSGHDTRGYAEQDWRRLARAGAVAAIYMGVRAAHFVQGRLLL